MQTISTPPTNPGIVLNIDQVMKDKGENNKWYRLNKRGQRRNKNSASIATSIATDRRVVTSLEVDDMSLELTDIKEEDARSLNLDDIMEERSGDIHNMNRDDLSVSESSSAAFSFHSSPAAATGADYPALYNPEKQQEYESNKMKEEMRAKYGYFYPVVGMMNAFQSGLCIIVSGSSGSGTKL